MTISYDPQADALYIKLKDGVFAENREALEGVVLDVGTDGDLLGIEILAASQRYPDDVTQVRVNLNAVVPA